MSRALADTSMFIARESRRPFNASLLPVELAVSAITIGELRAGVLTAVDLASRTQRLDTLTTAMKLEPIPVDDEVATQWALLRVTLRDLGARMGINDSWIAATAMALAIPVATQDDDFPELDGLELIRV